jgi:hypothetical protein
MRCSLGENLALDENLVGNGLVVRANQLVLAIYSRKSTETI